MEKEHSQGVHLGFPKFLAQRTPPSPHPYSPALGDTKTKDRKCHRRMAIFPGLEHHLPCPCVKIQPVFMKNSFLFQPQKQQDGAAVSHTGRKCTTGVPGIPPFQCVQVCNLPHCLTQLLLTLIQVWTAPSYLSTPPLARSVSVHSLRILCTLCCVLSVHYLACAPRSLPNGWDIHGPLSTQEPVNTQPTSTWILLTLAITSASKVNPPPHGLICPALQRRS